ncbi:MAG TPA: HAD-IIIC family phosphatase [Thermotogota bacterium]|nr:HAD-IIIC family phosphatase [Thermotogota bacterium]HPJ88281.1 HAD-IIIC family phosphatase [Thermotogota bacterium]
MKFALLTNINLEFMIRQFKNSDGLSCYSPDGYGVWQQELMDENSSVYADDVDAIFIIPDAAEMIRGQDTFEAKIEELNRTMSGVEQCIRDYSGKKKVFVSSIHLKRAEIRSLKGSLESGQIEDRWMEFLISLNDKYDNCYVFPLREMITELGSDEFYSDKLWYLGGVKYSIKAQNLLVNEIRLLMKALNKKRKKCLVLDLDNTLWGGVIGEDGVDGIELAEFKEGARYKDFQKRLKELREMGILLAVCSKNNPDDAMEVIRKHPHMVLREEDFVSFRINWEPKPKNVAEIAAELNIGIDSLVFIDDNPVEREAVRENLPEVTVPEFPKDTANLESFTHELYRQYFYTLENTFEDRDKTKMYRDNARRSTEQASATDLESFFRGLKTEIIIWKLQPADIRRAAELTQKTNQFNLTTKRYTEKDIEAFSRSEDYVVYIASVSDKYGDNGKVSLVIVKKDGRTAEIDSFIMSCRVMGRYIEDQILDFIEVDLKSCGVEQLNAQYIQTKKNMPVMKFYNRLGYRLLSMADGIKQYTLKLDEKPERKTYGELIEG